MSEEQSKPKDRRGPPIWVESLLNPQEYADTAKKYPKTFTNGGKAVSFSPSYHKGGKWRFDMGKGYTAEEIRIMGETVDNLESILEEAKRKLAELEANN